MEEPKLREKSVRDESTTVTVGRNGENRAASYLESKGYEILDRNFRMGRQGEIDLIARRLSAGAGKSAPETPAVLGSVASVSVADNAVLSVRSAETVSSIAGTGDVEISSLSSLSVGRIAGFSGIRTYVSLKE